MTYPEAPVPDSLPPSLEPRRKVVEIIDYSLCIAYIALGLVIAWTLAFGPERLHDSAGVQLVAGTGVPWGVIAGVFVAYAVLLTNRFTRVGGWVLGALLFGLYAVSVSHAIHDGANGSALAVGAAIAAALSQISGLARSMVAAEWRR